MIQGEDWEAGFASGLLNSLCFFPLLSYGATAPLAQIPSDQLASALAAGWDEKPVGRNRLLGTSSDHEDNMFKELLIAVALLQRRDAADRHLSDENNEDVEKGELQVLSRTYHFVS